MKVDITERIPIKMWLNNLEDAALKQAKNLANLPFAQKHIAIMPDSHLGYGMPIGSILATKDYIIPNAVGVDIGCGVLAIPLGISLQDIYFKEIFQKVSNVIQRGVGNYPEINNNILENFINDNEELLDLYDQLSSERKEEYREAYSKNGSLGAGNHFLEFQEDKKTKELYLMIHSGSRNLGHNIASYYNNLAKKFNREWFSCVPESHDLSFLPTDSEVGKDYIREMENCLDFAKENRKIMAKKVLEILFGKFYSVREFKYFDQPHNYARLESYSGKNYWVHRKGAMSARKNEIGAIPGSQGTSSFLVKGLGNRLSFNSCSHGAGRKMGRRKAQKELNLKTEVDKMNSLGVMHNITSQKDLDEAPGAYKDIHSVMESQKDLVEIIAELKPKGVLKG